MFRDLDCADYNVLMDIDYAVYHVFRDLDCGDCHLLCVMELIKKCCPLRIPKNDSVSRPVPVKKKKKLKLITHPNYSYGYQLSLWLFL